VTRLLEGVSLAVCWGSVGLVWAAGALYNILRTPRERRRMRSRSGSTALISVAVPAACAMLVLLGHAYLAGITLHTVWARVLGLVVLVASTVFALWARLSLGTMWSWEPMVKSGHQLRTRGPYALTRHPIYTGLLGMLLGTTLLGGIGPMIVLVPVGLIVFEVRIRAEERLMLAAFPGQYSRYRRQVPQLVPGLHVRRHPHSARP
jgi:protein-S-isoprenylcysteine O-methyltransferase Ste14